MRSLVLCAAILGLAASISAATPDLPSCDVWKPACHYTASNRESTYDINRVVVHKTEGATASGAASWFANCASGGSAEFTFDKANGYCYQSVREYNIAWHAGYGSTNRCAIGIEHSGWVSSNDTSTACYNESAIETASCVKYYAVPCSRTYIIGHNQVPGCSYAGGGGTSCHTDPGRYWNWTYYINKVASLGSTPPPPPANKTYTNDSPSASTGWATGTSAADKYGASYRYKSTAAVSDPASFSITVPGGSYTISAWWPAGTNRSSTTPFILPSGSTVSVNQKVNGGKWNTLGTVSLGSGAKVTKVSCWTTTGYVVVADAVKYYGP